MLVLFGAREDGCFREVAALYSDRYNRQFSLYTELITRHIHSHTTVAYLCMYSISYTQNCTVNIHIHTPDRTTALNPIVEGKTCKQGHQHTGWITDNAYTLQTAQRERHTFITQNRHSDSQIDHSNAVYTTPHTYHHTQYHPTIHNTTPFTHHGTYK